MECGCIVPSDFTAAISADFNSNERSVVRLQRMLALSLYGNFSTYQGSELDNAALAEVRRNFHALPEEFEFKPSTVKLGAIGVFCRQTLGKGSRLGPYQGKEVTGVEESSNTEGLWEVYRDGSLHHYIDAKDPIYQNWMYHIQCARGRKEQSLAATQEKDCLYFRALRDIEKGEELLVWYDHHQYTMVLGIPTQFNETSLFRKENSEESEDPNMKDVLSDSEGKCSPLPNSEDDGDDSDMDDDRSEDDSMPRPVSSAPTHIMHTYAPHPLIYSPMASTNHSMATIPSRSPHSSAGHGVYTVFPPYPPLSNMPWLNPVRKIHNCCPPPNTPAFPVIWPPHPGGHTLHPVATSLTSSHKPPNMEMFVRGSDGSHWRCNVCQRIFTSQGSLRAHARIHTGEKPYQCKFCQRPFTQASTLRSHERLHTGEKPYKCHSCGKAFTQSAGLRSHLKTHVPR